jgi:hypothetical protein
MPTTVNKPLKITAFNAKGTGRQTYEVRKHLQDPVLRHTSETSYEALHPKTDIYQTDCQDRHKDGTAVAVKKGIPHKCTELPPLLSIEATGVCIPIETLKCCLRLFINLCKDCGVTQTP